MKLASRTSACCRQNINERTVVGMGNSASGNRRFLDVDFTRATNEDGDAELFDSFVPKA